MYFFSDKYTGIKYKILKYTPAPKNANLTNSLLKTNASVTVVTF